MCNVNEIENVQHFLGTCPILREFRRYSYYFGKATLSTEEIVNVLNLKAIDLKNIVNYIMYTLKYRSELVNEYNIMRIYVKYSTMLSGRFHMYY